jgi:threonine/homoserine/homoserine lactone efflux protein
MGFNWVSFFLYISIGVFTPGPNNIMAMNYARNAGFKKGMVFILGMLSGVVVVMTLCMVFTSVLASIIPRIHFPMKIVGAAYILYLTIMTLLPSRNKKLYGGNGGFFAGAALPFVNVKIILYGITSISSFILPVFNSIAILAIFVVILSVVGVAGNVCWALFGSLFSAVFTRHEKALNIIMAILLLYCAVSLFI